MYHHVPSSIIRLLGALVFLLVLSQIWSKPTEIDPNQLEPIESPDESPDAESPAPQPSTNKPARPLELDASFDALHARMINPGKPPSAKWGRILDDFNREQYWEVEAQLTKLPQEMLTGDRARNFAAALWNNVGVHQEQSLGVDVSVKAFEKATALAPHNPVALLNLTQAYWGLHDEALTPAFLESVLRVAPHDPFLHIALADLLLENGDTAEAEQHLKFAQAQALADPRLKPYFQRLTGELGHQNTASLQGPGVASEQPSTTSIPSSFPTPADAPQSSTVGEKPVAPSGQRSLTND